MQRDPASLGWIFLPDMVNDRFSIGGTFLDRELHPFWAVLFSVVRCQSEVGF